MSEPISETRSFKTGGESAADLLPALQRLDRLLERAMDVASTAYGPDAATDPYRGLYIDQAGVDRLLARAPLEPALPVERTAADDPLPDRQGDSSRLTWLRQAYGLSPFELDVLLIALAPEIDLRYERLYSYLQDDVTRRRPSVDLALNLLCRSAQEKLDRRAHFTSESPLIRHQLLHLIVDPQQCQPPLLAQSLKPDEQIVGFLLGHDALDARLSPFCEWVEPTVVPEEAPLEAATRKALIESFAHAWESIRPLTLYFHGPQGTGKRDAAEALSGEVGAPLLVADLGRALALSRDFDQTLKLLFREAWFRGAVVYLASLDVLRKEDRSLEYRRLLDALVEDGGITILAGTQPWAPAGHDPIGVLAIPFSVPSFPERRALWEARLDEAGIKLHDVELNEVATRLRLTRGQIAEAVAAARNRWGATPGLQKSKTLDGRGRRELLALARMQCGHELAALAKRIEPLCSWDDIVLPADALAQLREICQRVFHRDRVLGEWGFDRKLSGGKGVNALFAGPSGTGKTMAAEIIANELELDLYRIDLSGVVSKYIGETEKNLDRVFRAAEAANSILFFDEADALFGKRSEVRDSHDRYANVEISYLLQKMEEYEGVAILATNLRQNLDESFVRRLAFTVHFPFPDERDRKRIWSGIWPAETPVAENLDLDSLAHHFKLSGGNIKNVALAAAFLAAADGGSVTTAHVIQATRREYQKLGKPLSEAELAPFGVEAAHR